MAADGQPAKTYCVYSVWVCMQYTGQIWAGGNANAMKNYEDFFAWRHSEQLPIQWWFSHLETCLQTIQTISARSRMVKQAMRSDISCLSVLCCMACLEVNRPSRNLVPAKGQWQWSIPPFPTCAIMSLTRHLKSSGKISLSLVKLGGVGCKFDGSRPFPGSRL